jgi:hypothetical protein
MRHCLSDIICSLFYIRQKIIVMIRDEIEDISDKDIEKWLKNFKT